MCRWEDILLTSDFWRHFVCQLSSSLQHHPVTGGVLDGLLSFFHGRASLAIVEADFLKPTCLSFSNEASAANFDATDKWVTFQPASSHSWISSCLPNDRFSWGALHRCYPCGEPWVPPGIQSTIFLSVHQTTISGSLGVRIGKNGSHPSWSAQISYLPFQVASFVVDCFCF